MVDIDNNQNVNNINNNLLFMTLVHFKEDWLHPTSRDDEYIMLADDEESNRRTQSRLQA
jgi:hypothetical protein